MIKTIKQNFYWLLFFAFIIIGYFLTPSAVFLAFPSLSIIFLLAFGASMTCFIKKLLYASNVVTKIEGGLGLLLPSILEIGILPACAITCTGLKLGLLSAFHLFFINILPSGYGVYIVSVLILFQFIIMYNVGCLYSEKTEKILQRLKAFFKKEDKEIKKKETIK